MKVCKTVGLSGSAGVHSVSREGRRARHWGGTLHGERPGWVSSLAGRRETEGNVHQSREAHKAGGLGGVGLGDRAVFLKGSVGRGAVFATLAILDTKIPSKPYNCSLAAFMLMF